MLRSPPRWEHVKGDVPPMEPVKPTYQRMLCPIVWHRSHPHCRGRHRITHPTHLHMVRTYNFSTCWALQLKIFHKSWSSTLWSVSSFEDAIQKVKDSHTVRPWPCLMPITRKQPHGLAAESWCTVSCAPYEMPEEILGWSGTRNATRPSSTYGNSTRKVRKVDCRHPAMGGGMCAMQTAILPRGFWRNNQKEGLGNAQQVLETTTAKAENQVIGAGPRSPAAIDHRVCMFTVRCWRRPDGGIPWVEVTRREYHRNFVTPSTPHERISLIQRQIPIVRQRTGMTSLPMTPRHLDTPQWLTGSAAEHATAVEPTNASVVNDARDTARLNGWAYRYSETPLQTMPSHTTTGGVM